MLFGKRERIISRLLIVEDEPLVAFDNEHFLRDQGFEVVATVDRVEDAVTVIGADGIDLILADVNLSEGDDGIDVAYAARAKGIPLLFVTGSCPIEARALAVGCLAKPYTQRDLRGAIDAVEAKLAGMPVKRKPKGLSLYDHPADKPS
jgi:DNA-binding response OmpR family regulator